MALPHLHAPLRPLTPLPLGSLRQADVGGGVPCWPTEYALKLWAQPDSATRQAVLAKVRCASQQRAKPPQGAAPTLPLPPTPNVPPPPATHNHPRVRACTLHQCT